jgi:hypothetical protein
VTWASFDEFQQEITQTVDGCQKFLFITRGKEFQEEVIVQLKSLLNKIQTAKTQAIEDKAKQWANLLLFYECITQAFLEFAGMWVEIKNGEMDKAWDSLIDAQTAVRAALLVRDDRQLHTFNERLHLIESVMFPSPMFTSIGITVESAECSICGQEYGECGHIKGRVYLGQICACIVKKWTLNEVSFVDDPADKHCRTLSFGEGGMMRNFMTWRPVAEDRGGESVPPTTPQVED